MEGSKLRQTALAALIGALASPVIFGQSLDPYLDGDGTPAGPQAAPVSFPPVPHDLSQSIKGFTFLGTHNSYDDPYSTGENGTIVEQLDAKNVWFLEIDVCGVVSPGDWPNPTNEFMVCHPDPWSLFLDCEDELRLPLSWIMQWIRDSRTFQDRARFTVLWFDIKTAEPVCDWPLAPSEYCVALGLDWSDCQDHYKMTQLEEHVRRFLDPADQGLFYTKAQWNNGYDGVPGTADDQGWPSIETLVDRGTFFIPVWDHNSIHHDLPFFFITAANLSDVEPWTAFVNKECSSIDLSSGDNPSGSDHLLWRVYGFNPYVPLPPPFPPSGCEYYSNEGLEQLVAAGYNFLCTDAINDLGNHSNPYMFQPVPLYVDWAGLGHPFGWGTWYNPYAVDEMGLSVLEWFTPTGARLVFAPGDYPGAVLFHRQMTLMNGASGADPNRTGPVRLGTP